VFRPRRKRRRKSKERGSYYPLHEIRLRIKKGKVQVTGTAYSCALQDFGWGEKDILDAVRKLKPWHFYKTEECRVDPGQMVDYYKARGLKGENVYTSILTS
jgi:hypothetical protein